MVRVLSGKGELGSPVERWSEDSGEERRSGTLRVVSGAVQGDPFGVSQASPHASNATRAKREKRGAKLIRDAVNAFG
jgi:hypothetical protein